MVAQFVSTSSALHAITLFTDRAAEQAGLLGYQKGNFPIAEDLANSVLSLPIWPGMIEAHAERVCSVIRKLFSHG